MAALKTLLVLVLVAMVFASAVAVRVGPCNQVCSRTNPEKDECCRAHGYRGHSSCAGGQMNCY